MPGADKQRTEAEKHRQEHMPGADKQRTETEKHRKAEAAHIMRR